MSAHAASAAAADDDDYDFPDGDAHELQPLDSSTSSPHQRLNRSQGKSAKGESDSEDYDEDFADETFRLRGPGGDSLDLDRDKSEGEEGGEDEEVVPIIRHGGRRSKIKEEIPTDDPAALIHSIVAETDDPTLPAFTIRVVLIGSFFCILGAGLNQLFFFKSNSPSFSSYFVILISLPIGRWMARHTPNRRIYFGPWSFELNPGPFSMKEHVLVNILASSGSTAAYASDIISLQDLFYNQRMGIIASLTLLITTQTLGFGLAGLVEKVLVKPVAMIFPRNLVTTTMFYTLHDRKSRDTQARLQYFAMIFIAIFLYQFLPALFMPTLSSIAVLCLVNNKSNTFRVLSSGYKGLGFLDFSFDWNAISASGPLYQPWSAALNFYAGIAGAMFIVVPIVYFNGMWDADKFPSPIDAGLYHDKTFTKFDILTLLKPDNTLDWDKYNEQKPVLLTPWFAINYGIGFATITSMLSHVFLWHRKEIFQALRHANHEDIHNRLMRAYPAVPKRWYMTLLTISLSSAILLVIFSPLQLPVWGLLLAVLMGVVFLIPIGIIKAVSDTSIGLNIASEFLHGYIQPGRPIANVTFKCYGYLSLVQALDLITDLKLGLYLKIPPKHMFVSQLFGTILGCVVNLAVLRIVLNPANGYRAFIDGSAIDPTSQWDGRKLHIFFSAASIWGAIGPKEFFWETKYKILFLGFIVGFITPVIPYLLNKRWPSKSWSLISFPVFYHGAGIPPQLPSNIIISGFIAAYLSQYWARVKHPKWFKRRNYVLASALDAGTSVNALVVFLLSISALKAFPLAHWFMNPATDSEHCFDSS